MSESARIKRIIGGAYSWASDRVYDRVVVNGGFKLFGGDIHDFVRAQGRKAIVVAGGGPILDMPVGTAYFTTDVAGHYPGLVVGVDIAEGMVREARRVATRSGAHLEVLQGDAHALPFRDGAFPAILCTLGLQVIPGLDASARELARVLAPGGSLFVSVITMGLPLSREARAKLPTIMRPGDDVTAALNEAGLTARVTGRRRLATLMEAVKPT